MALLTMLATPLLRALQLLGSAAPLLLVVIFSLLLQLAMHASLLGLPLLYLVGSWFFKYAFVMLEHAAQGRPGAPVLTMEDANPFGEMRPLQLGLLVATGYGVSVAVTALMGEGAALVLRVAGMIVLPAVIAVQAVTGSMLQALNPRAAAAMIRSLGSDYVTLMIVAVTCALLAQWIVLGDGGHLGVLLRIACTMLLWLLLFAVLGCVIHARRFEIGHEPEHSPERTAQRDATAVQKERDRFVDLVFGEYRSGSSQNAFESIKRRAGPGVAAIPEYTWILQRVSAWPTRGLAHRVAQELLGLLLAHQRNGAALTLVRAQMKTHPDFRPATAEQMLRIAQLARDGGDWPLARALISDFSERFPAHPALGRVQMLAEQLQKR